VQLTLLGVPSLRGFDLLSGLSSSDRRSDAEACGRHSPRGDQSTPLSSWAALLTLREPATQAVRDGRDRPALILIPVMCCMLRWMLLGGRVGLGIVIRPFYEVHPAWLACFLLCLPRPCSRTPFLHDIAWLGNLAGQGAVPVAESHTSCMALKGSHLPFFLPCTVTHMCHDMTDLAIRAGRLGAKTFCLPLAGIARHGLIA